MKWIRKWEVGSSSSDRAYVVSEADTGEFGCSCPHWINRRADCKHIQSVRKMIIEGGSWHSQIEGPPIVPMAAAEPAPVTKKSIRPALKKAAPLSGLEKIRENATWRF